MQYLRKICAHAALLSISLLVAGASQAGESAQAVVPTDRALKLSDTLTQGSLKDRLQSCATHSFYPTDFSIAHRGAPLGYPEHSREGYIAAAEQGAGVHRMRCHLYQGLGAGLSTLSVRSRHYNEHSTDLTGIQMLSPPFVRPSESSPPARLAAPQIFRWRSSKPCAPARIAATGKLKTLKSI